MSSKHWQDLVSDKKRRQLQAIPKDWLITPPSEDVLDVRHYPEGCGVLSERELQITNTTDVEVLLGKLATAEWSSMEVTTAFYKRAIVAHQLVNCLTEIYVERALARAAELDKHLAETGTVVGPLHGLPISLKDQICVKGIESTMGYASWIGNVSERNAVMTEILQTCGAIPFVMTNVPQTLMWPETYNHIYGRTLNPANRTLTCGGSSGGEGALIAMRGSPLGVGSDIGGSVRYPAAFNGTYSLRPSYGRLPYNGVLNSLQGQDSAPSSLGPLSNSLSGVKTLVKAVIGQEPWNKDPLCIRKRWDEDAYQLADHGRGQDLCFAIMWDDGVTVPHPPVLRALEMTKSALLAVGHTVFDWRPLKHAEIYDNVGRIWMAGALEDIAAVTAASGEPYLTTMAMPGAPVVDIGINCPPVISAYALWQLHVRRRDLRKEYLDYWQDTVRGTGTGRPVDAIISPVAPSVAMPHGTTKVTTYTVVWSALDCPCTVFPVTTVDQALDVKRPEHTFLSEDDKENYRLYDPLMFQNAPVGLQLAGRTLEEEAVIAMTELVDAALKKQSSSA